MHCALYVFYKANKDDDYLISISASAFFRFIGTLILEEGIQTILNSLIIRSCISTALRQNLITHFLKIITQLDRLDIITTQLDRLDTITTQFDRLDIITIPSLID